jgi:hypothetical protein
MRPAMLALAALPVCAHAEALDLTPAERAAFGAEVRALLLEEPEIVARALRGPNPNAARIESDLALIGARAGRLFDPEAAHLLGGTGPVAMAVFTPPDGPLAERLRAYARDNGLRIALHDPAQSADLMAALTLDTVPSYVFPTVMVRGDVPLAVLERYR